MTDEARAGLAAHLGVMRPDGLADVLAALQPSPAFVLGSKEFDVWLEGMFGFPLTVTPDAGTYAKSATPRMLQLQLQHLSFDWADDDLQDWTVPDLDPDLLDSTELRQDDTGWPALFRSRAAELRVRFDALARAASYHDALRIVFTARETASLGDLADAERSGQPIETQLASLGLDLSMFRRLVSYSDTVQASPLSTAERDDLAHLLTQVWKVRDRYPAWLAEEAAMPTRLWPTEAYDGAWISGFNKRKFAPWRGTMARRLDLETRLIRRWQTWQATLDSHTAAVDLAQRTALPLLRDGLVGLTDLPRAGLRMDDLTRRWLIDIAATATTQVTAIDEATFAAQTLIDGVRNQRFEAGHPAHAWAVEAASVGSFDAEWAWLDNLAHFRGAVMNYLYPENALYPELRMTGVLGVGENLHEFKPFLNELRKVRPVTPESLPMRAVSKFPSAALENTYAALKGAELGYFAPAAIALALQRGWRVHRGARLVPDGVRRQPAGWEPRSSRLAPE